MNKHLFNDVMHLVLEERKLSYRSVRTARWEREISKRTEEYFEGVAIEDIDDNRLCRFFSFLKVKDNGELYSDKYIKAVYSIVKATFRKAVIKKYIPVNPMEYEFKRPKGHIPDPKERIISDDCLKCILVAVKDIPLYDTIVRLLLLTGMRIGELLGLYWTDIDFDNNIIHIRRSAAAIYKENYNGSLEREGIGVFETKTKTSSRDLPVDAECMDVLTKWLLFRDEPDNANWLRRIEEKNNLNVVFPNQIGQLMDYSLLRQGFNEVLKKHGIMENVSFHKFRHNYATNLLSAGVDIAVVSQMLGHSNIETTANTYVKVRLEPMRSAVKMYSQYLKKLKIL